MSERTALYRAFDAKGVLLYVGIARNWARRWAQHSERSAFFSEVRRLDVEWCDSREEALAKEAALIRTHQPKFNTRGLRVRRAVAKAKDEPLIAGVCEVCGKEPAYSFSWFPDPTRRYERRSGFWKVTGYCTADDEHYYITFERWVTEDDWLRHLRTTKKWFNEADFRAAVARVPHPASQAALHRQKAGRYGEA